MICYENNSVIGCPKFISIFIRKHPVLSRKENRKKIDWNQTSCLDAKANNEQIHSLTEMHIQFLYLSDFKWEVESIFKEIIRKSKYFQHNTSFNSVVAWRSIFSQNGICIITLIRVISFIFLLWFFQVEIRAWSIDLASIRPSCGVNLLS